MYTSVSVLNKPVTGQKQWSWLLKDILALEDKFFLEAEKQITCLVKFHQGKEPNALLRSIIIKN